MRDFAETKLDRYPVPKVEDLFATLSNGKLFTKLDLRQAYQQLLLDVKSKKYVVINTTKGLFQYTRLPYKISLAPGIFHGEVEHLLQGIPGVVVYLDDLLVTGQDKTHQLRTLETVLSRWRETGLQVKKSKCLFMVPTVSFLGHRIDADGLHPLDDKVRAIEAAPTPTNVTELKRGLRKSGEGSVKSRLAKVLFTYRLTPHTTTGVPPAEMLLGRRPRSRLDILRPLTAKRVEEKQVKKKSKHNAHAHERLLNEGDTVLVRNYLHGEKWEPGTITKKTGPASYSVKLTDVATRIRLEKDLLK